MAPSLRVMAAAALALTAAPAVNAGGHMAKEAPAYCDGRELNLAEFADMNANKTFHAVVDVRRQAEWEGYGPSEKESIGHVPGAFLIDSLATNPELNATLSCFKDDPIAVICRTGSRSRASVAILKEAGFACPINIDGGTQGYAEMGNEIHKGNATEKDTKPCAGKEDHDDHDGHDHDHDHDKDDHNSHDHDDDKDGHDGHDHDDHDKDMPAMFPTEVEALAAAAKYGCTGAHQMGSEWMVGATHGGCDDAMAAMKAGMNATKDAHGDHAGHDHDEDDHSGHDHGAPAAAPRAHNHSDGTHTHTPPPPMASVGAAPRTTTTTDASVAAKTAAALLGGAMALLAAAC